MNSLVLACLCLGVSGGQTLPSLAHSPACLSDGPEDEDIAANDDEQGEEEYKAEEQHGVGTHPGCEGHVVPGAGCQQPLRNVGTWEPGISARASPWCCLGSLQMWRFGFLSTTWPQPRAHPAQN